MKSHYFTLSQSLFPSGFTRRQPYAHTQGDSWKSNTIIYHFRKHLLDLRWQQLFQKVDQFLKHIKIHIENHYCQVLITFLVLQLQPIFSRNSILDFFRGDLHHHKSYSQNATVMNYSCSTRGLKILNNAKEYEKLKTI